MPTIITHDGRDVELTFVKMKMLHPTTQEYVEVTPAQLDADAALKAAFVAELPDFADAHAVRRPYNQPLDEGGYLKDGGDNILNREGNDFKVNWEASNSLPDYNYVTMFNGCAKDTGATV